MICAKDAVERSEERSFTVDTILDSMKSNPELLWLRRSRIPPYAYSLVVEAEVELTNIMVEQITKPNNQGFDMLGFIAMHSIQLAALTQQIGPSWSGSVP